MYKLIHISVSLDISYGRKLGLQLFLLSTINLFESAIEFI